MPAASIAITNTDSRGIEFKLEFTAATTGSPNADVPATKIDLLLTTNVIDNLGMYQKRKTVIPHSDTVNNPHDGYAYFDLTLAEQSRLFGSSTVNQTVITGVNSHVNFRYRAYSETGIVLCDLNISPTADGDGNVIVHNREPEQPYGATVGDYVTLVGHDQFVTFDFNVLTHHELTDAEGVEGTTQQAEIMVNVPLTDANGNNNADPGIRTVLVDLDQSNSVEQVGLASDKIYRVRGRTTVGDNIAPDFKEIIIANNLQHEMAVRVYNKFGPSLYSKTQTIVCSNKLPKVVMPSAVGVGGILSTTTTPEEVYTYNSSDTSYLADVYTSFKAGVYDAANTDGIKDAYNIENRNTEYAAQILATLLDTDIDRPDSKTQIEFGIISEEQLADAEGNPIFYPDLNLADGDAPNPTPTRPVKKFVAGKCDTYEIESGSEKRYKSARAVITRTGNTAGYANNIEIGAAGVVGNTENMSNRGLFVRNSWYNGYNSVTNTNTPNNQTDILVSARLKQTTTVTTTVTAEDGTVTNDTSDNTVYGEVETLGRIFRIEAPTIATPRLPSEKKIILSTGEQYITCNAANDDHPEVAAATDAGYVMDEVNTTVRVVVTNNNGLNLTLAGGAGGLGQNPVPGDNL